MTTKSKKRPIVIPGDQLGPDVERQPIESEFSYWIGALPDAPFGQIDVGGIDFPKLQSPVTSGKGKNQERTTFRGRIAKLTRSDIERIRKGLTRRVIRTKGFAHVGANGSSASVSDNTTAFEQGGGEVRDNIGVADYAERPAPAMYVVVPTEEELQAATAQGRHLAPYVPTDRDRKLSDFIYMVPVEDRRRPSLDAELPPSMTETGLILPPED